MTRNRRSTALGIRSVLTVLLVVGASVPVAGIGGITGSETLDGGSSVATVPVGSSPSTSTVASRTIDLTQELQLTSDRPGEITVTLRYSVPDDVVELTTRLPDGATVTSTRGFAQRDGTEYAWDQRTDDPTLTYRLAVNQTLDATGPIAGKGDYVFVDPGAWALIRIPQVATGWSWTGGGTVSVSRTTTTAGPGAVGNRMAFLGEHREVTRTAHGQIFRLIVPASADLAASPTAILDSVTAASNTLRVGDRDPEVFMVAAPTGAVRWGVRGLQTGDSDTWVRDSERLGTADNVWLHEYVHTRQGYASATDVQWFTEASASYYAAFLALQQDRIDFGAFRDRLLLGTRAPDREAVLADPTTWDTVAPYTKGALVAGELDRKTRRTTDRSHSLQDVLGRMNGHSEPVTGAAFREMIREVGRDETTVLADSYTTTRETPSMWDRPAHDLAFDSTPAQIGYALPTSTDPSGYRVRGPYRTDEVGGGRPLRLAVGETLAFDVRVTNTGGTAGDYDAQLLVNGDPQGRRTGRLKPNETRTVSFTYRFTDAGEYTVSVGGDMVTVSVYESATPTVTDIRVEAPRRADGEGSAVTVTARVRNDHSIPAASNLTLYQDGESVETRRVTLGPDEEQTVSFEEVLVSPGDHVFRVTDRTTTVRIPPTQVSASKSTATSGDGFGVIPVLVGSVILLLALGRRR